MFPGQYSLKNHHLVLALLLRLGTRPRSISKLDSDTDFNLYCSNCCSIFCVKIFRRKLGFRSRFGFASFGTNRVLVGEGVGQTSTFCCEDALTSGGVVRGSISLRGVNAVMFLLSILRSHAHTFCFISNTSASTEASHWSDCFLALLLLCRKAWT